MNYTEKYHLPQWEETDRVLRTDFNRMCADMEAGLNKTAADAAADTAQVRNSAAQAQSTANTAVSKADTAQATANAAYCSSYKPYVVGTYVGNGQITDGLVVKLGFTPSAVLVSGVAMSSGCQPQTLAASTGAENSFLTIIDGGFTVVHHLAENMPHINDPGIKYTYVAFR